MPSHARPRLVTLVLAALVLAGCSATNTITTQFDYAPSDGIKVTLGDVTGHNLLFLAEAVGEPGVLIGSLVNDSSDTLEVSLSVDGVTSTDITLGPGEIAFLGPESGQVLITGPALIFPGLSAEVWVLTDATGAITIKVPSTDSTLPEYARVLELLAAITPPEPSPSPEPDDE